jgi:hypothetical protein
MPRRGYKKPDAKTRTLRFRVTGIEARVMEEAARRAKAQSLSDWLRDLALVEAERLGVLVRK